MSGDIRQMLPTGRKASLFHGIPFRLPGGRTLAGHSPMQFAQDLSAKLASRSRHVCVFLGAGAARACGLPDLASLQGHVLEHLSEPYQGALNLQLFGRPEELRVRSHPTSDAVQAPKRNLEAALSRVRRIAALVEGSGSIDGLTHDMAVELDRQVCRAVIEALRLDGARFDPVDALAGWAARSGYAWPIELFTVNYDLLIETALERRRAPYFDGFVGSLAARFHTDMVEATPDQRQEWLPSSFTRLWKLHGSVNWRWEDGRTKEIVRTGQAVPDGHAAAIYPSDAKYEESRRVPFVVLQDRFRKALSQDETLLIIAGYSFGDAHLNEVMFEAVARRHRSEVIVFCYSEIPPVVDSEAQSAPNLQVVAPERAIIGGRSGPWERPTDDAAPPDDVWAEGRFLLGDFGNLAKYLARRSAQSGNSDSTS